MAQTTLVLGLGGLGVSVISRVRRRYSAVSAGARLPAAFIGIDQEDIERESQGGLDLDSRFVIRTERVSEILNNLNRRLSNSAPTWKEHLAWFPEGDNLQLIDAMPPGGARRYRALGRLGLSGGADLVERWLRQSLARLRQEAPGLEPPRIYLVSSLGGGTGSGMLLDIAYLLRRLEPSCYLAAYLALPEIYADLSGETRARANTLAALSEVISLRAQRVPFDVHHLDLLPFSIPVGARELLARVFLFGQAATQEKEVDSYERVAQAIFASLIPAIEKATRESVKSLPEMVDMARREALATEALSTCGAARIDLTPVSLDDPRVLEAIWLGLKDAMPSAPDLETPGGGGEDASRPLGASDALAPPPAGARQASPAQSATADGFKRWKLAVDAAVKAGAVKLQEFVTKRLGLLDSRLDLGWFATELDWRDLESVEELLGRVSSPEPGEVGKDLESLDPFSLVEDDLRTANEQFLLSHRGPGAAGTREALRRLCFDSMAPPGSEFAAASPGERKRWKGWRVEQALGWIRKTPFFEGHGKVYCHSWNTRLYRLADGPEFLRLLQRHLLLHAAELLVRGSEQPRGQETPTSGGQAGPARWEGDVAPAKEQRHPFPPLTAHLTERIDRIAPGLGSWYREVAPSIPPEERWLRLRQEVEASPLAGWFDREARWILDQQASGHEILRNAIGRCGEGLFLKSPDGRRRAFVIALVPRGLFWPAGQASLRESLNAESSALLDSTCRMELYEGDKIWLYHEDLRNSVFFLKSLDTYRQAYRAEPFRQMLHIDQRMLKDPGFLDLAVTEAPGSGDLA